MGRYFDKALFAHIQGLVDTKETRNAQNGYHLSCHFHRKRLSKRLIPGDENHALHVKSGVVSLALVEKEPQHIIIIIIKSSRFIIVHVYI